MGADEHDIHALVPRSRGRYGRSTSGVRVPASSALMRAVVRPSGERLHRGIRALGVSRFFGSRRLRIVHDYL